MAVNPESFEYQVVFEGKIAEGFSEADVRSAFGIRYGEDAANKVFSQPRVVLKQKLERAQAEKIQATLNGFGMRTKLERLRPRVTELRLVEDEPAPAVTPSAPAAPPAAPPAATGGATTSAAAPAAERNKAAPATVPGHEQGVIAARVSTLSGKPQRTYDRRRVEAAFPGPLGLPPVSAAYRSRLFAVAALMLLLPALYGAITLASLYGVYWLAMPGREALFAAVRPGYLSVTGYGAVLFAAALFSLFLFRPFLTRGARGPQAVSLDLVREPVLFALVEKITEVTGAPMPAEIQVDVNANASASLGRSPFSRELTLTIGLPLFWGLDVRALTGVLAHEFGHFAQRWGMRAARIVHGINHWFHRQVHERDRWDDFVQGLAEREFLLFTLAAALAQLGSTACRLVLARLAHLAGLISLSFSRQMEFDADRYEIALVGSEHYERSAVALRMLGMAQARIFDDVGSALAAGSMVDNIPCLIARRASQLGDAERQRVLKDIDELNTSVYDTHPADQERIEAARVANAAGGFAFEGSARGLLRELDRLSKVATLQWYRSLGIHVVPSELVPADSFEAEAQQLDRANAAGERYFAGLAELPVWMALPEGDAFGQLADEALAAERSALADRVELGRKAFAGQREVLLMHRAYAACYGHARFWQRLGIEVPASAYDRPVKTGSLTEIDAKLAEHQGGAADLEHELAEFTGVLGQRLAADLEYAARQDAAARQEIAALRAAHELLGRTAGKERTLVASSELLAMLVDATDRVEGDLRRLRDVSRELETETARNEQVQSAIRQALATLDPAFAQVPSPAEDPVLRARQAIDNAGMLLNRVARHVRATRGRMAELALGA